MNTFWTGSEQIPYTGRLLATAADPGSCRPALGFVIPCSKHRLDLSIAWDRCGQVQVKSCAAPWGTDRPQAPAMRLND
jgi:hypothetical protein